MNTGVVLVAVMVLVCGLIMLWAARKTRRDSE